MDERERTRRELLRGAAGVAGVGALSSVAGCFGILGGGGGDGGNDTPTAGPDPTATATPTPTPTKTEGPGAVEGSFRRWLPTGEAFQGDPNYRFFYYDVPGFAQRRDAMHPNAYGRVKQVAGGTAAVLGINAGDLVDLVRFVQSDVRVVTGNFDPATVEEALTSQKYRKDADYEGYRIYSGGTDPPVVAVGDGAAMLCRGSGTNTPVAVARLLVDTGRGARDRYHEAREDVDLLTADLVGHTHVGGGLIAEVGETNVESGLFRGMIGFAAGFQVGSSETTVDFVVAFVDEQSASEAPVGEWVDGSAGLEPYRDVSVSVAGRTARVTGTAPTDQFDFLTPGSPGQRTVSLDPDR